MTGQIPYELVWDNNHWPILLPTRGLGAHINRLGFSLSFSNFDLEATSSSHQSRTISKEVFKSTFKTLKLSEKAT